MAKSYFQITAKCEEVDESSCTVQSTGEVVTKIQLSQVVPTMRERVLCELPLEVAPKPDTLERAGNVKNPGWSSPLRARGH